MKITRKKIIIVIAVLLVAGFAGSRVFGKKTPTLQTAEARRADLVSEVSATGKVEASENLNLAFEKSGKVALVSATVGKKVSVGAVLAFLDQKNELAALTSARGSLAAAQANFDKVLAGASSEEVAVAQSSLDAAKAALVAVQNQQAVLVLNALAAFNNSTPAAIPKTSNISSVTAEVSGTYTGSAQGIYKLTAYDTGLGPFVNVTGLESADFQVRSNAPTALGTHGLFVEFSSTAVQASDVWEIEIPNTKASNYVTNYNTYQAALQTQASAISSAQSAVDSAQASLNLKKAQARPADLAAAKAQLLSAQGGVQSAQAALEASLLRAPFAGTVTKVDIQRGQIISVNTAAISLISENKFEIKAFIPEADIARLKLGQEASVILDAYSSDVKFSAKVIKISPGETLIDGVSTYQTTFAFENPDERIRSGMTANLDILTDKREGIIIIPARAVFAKESAKFVKVMNPDQTVAEVEVKTGLRGSDGNIEITEGLSEGQKVLLSNSN